MLVVSLRSQNVSQCRQKGKVEHFFRKYTYLPSFGEGDEVTNDNSVLSI